MYVIILYIKKAVIAVNYLFIYLFSNIFKLESFKLYIFLYCLLLLNDLHSLKLEYTYLVFTSSSYIYIYIYISLSYIYLFFWSHVLTFLARIFQKF